MNHAKIEAGLSKEEVLELVGVPDRYELNPEKQALWTYGWGTFIYPIQLNVLFLENAVDTVFLIED